LVGLLLRGDHALHRFVRRGRVAVLRKQSGQKLARHLRQQLGKLVHV
jgi:hypothetical protein